MSCLHFFGMLDASPPVGLEARPFAKWGEASIAGWQALPDVLLKNQHKLELSPTEMLVLINILSFWWYVDELPFPRATTIARRMNITTRTVQRAIQKMIDSGLLARRKEPGLGSKDRDLIDPSGLVQKLKSLAADDPSFLHKQQKVVPRAEAAA